MVVFASPVVNSQGKIEAISLKHEEEIDADKEKIVRIAGETNEKIYTLATKGKNYFIKVSSVNEMH